MFEWDESKAKVNKSKHGISFADTFAVFEDPNAVTVEDFREGEQRYVTPLAWTHSAAYWWWFTHGVRTTFGLFPHAGQCTMR